MNTENVRRMAMFGIGNDQLAMLPTIRKGDTVHCPHCNGAHELKAGTNQETGEESDLLFYNCGETAYLASMRGKSLMSVFNREEE